MTMQIVESIPYIAFFAAGLLVAWAGVDLLRSRKARPAAVKPEPGCGVSGSVQPLRRAEPEAEPAPAEAAVEAAAPEPQELTPVPDSAQEPAVPVSLAVEMPAPTSADTVRDDPVPESAVMAAASERSEVLVRREPSVRVFDTAVAPSERKVLAD